MLDSARQAIRWAIPGWLFFTFLFLFAGVDIIIKGTSAVEFLIKDVPVFEGGTGPTMFVLLVAGLGLTLGYLLYQLYYWGYWRGFEWGREKPLDKGLAVLRDTRIDTNKLFWEPLRLVDPEDESKECIPYSFRERLEHWLEHKTDFNRIIELVLFVRTQEDALRYKRNWFLAESVFYKTVLDNNVKYWEDRAVFMADVYHSLGATRVTLVIVFLLYCLTSLLSQLGTLTWYPDWAFTAKSLGVWVANGALFTVIYVILRSNRRTTRENLITLKRHVIISYNQRRKGLGGRDHIGKWLQNREEVERTGIRVVAEIPSNLGSAN